MARSTSSARRSNRSAWKAVAAAGIGVVLLGAGGATFAEWQDQEALATDTTITAGTLDLIADADAGTWTNVAGTDVTAAVIGGSYLIVPGDALTYRETLDIDARGDLLTGTVSHNLGSLSGSDELRAQLAASATMTLNGEAVTGTSAQVVADDELQSIDVAITVAFDSTTANLVGQGQSVLLSGLDVTLAQNAVSGS